MLSIFIEKITAFITAIIISLFNFNIIEPIYIENPDTTIINNGSGSYYSWGTHIISSYSDLVVYSKINNSDKMKDFLTEFTPDFFVMNSIIIEDVELSGSNQKTYITSVNQINNEINLEYVLVNDMLGGTDAICHESICIIAKKPVTKVNVFEKEKIYLPFISRNDFTPFYDIVEIESISDIADATYFIKDFESWQNFINEKSFDFVTIPDTINEVYFENNNLGIITTSVPDSSHEIRVSEINPYEIDLTVDYYSVSQPKVGLTMVSYNAIFVYANKTTETFAANKHNFSIPFNLDGTY